jgi:trehalose-6-phosphate synthase
MPVEDNDNNNTNNKNDDNNTDNKHSNPVTVIVKRIAKKIKSKNLKNGFQEFLRKSLNKKAIWELIQLDQLTNLNLNMLSYLGSIIMIVLQNGKNQQYDMNGYKKVES